MGLPQPAARLADQVPLREREVATAAQHLSSSCQHVTHPGRAQELDVERGGRGGLARSKHRDDGASHRSVEDRRVDPAVHDRVDVQVPRLDPARDGAGPAAAAREVDLEPDLVVEPVAHGVREVRERGRGAGLREVASAGHVERERPSRIGTPRSRADPTE